MTRLVQAELLKLRTTRSARILLALAGAGTAALVALVCLFGGRPGQPALGDDALRQLVLVPAKPLTLAALVLGVLAMAGELRHGTATSTFLVAPVRGRVVAAKLVAVADPGLGAPVAGLAVAVALYAVLGVGLAALVRNQVAAAVVGVLWWSQGVEQILVGVLRQPGLERWLPMGAASALTAPGDGTLAMWAGGLVFAAYGLVLALAGGRLVVRRDLT
jgi:ABC-2 type transport system permease protein